MCHKICCEHIIFKPGARLWTFSSSLMYSLTVFTTIGITFSLNSTLTNLNFLYYIAICCQKIKNVVIILPMSYFSPRLRGLFFSGYGNLTTRTALGKVPHFFFTWWWWWAWGWWWTWTFRWWQSCMHWLASPWCSSTWPTLAPSSPPPSSTPTQRCAGGTNCLKQMNLSFVQGVRKMWKNFQRRQLCLQ